MILHFNSGFNRLKSPGKGPSEPENHFSILVPFRNEENNLPTLLKSINKLDYPKDMFQLILVDDSSSDKSKEIAIQFRDDHQELNILVIENDSTGNSPKKSALNKGISLALKPWILTTDADCIVPPSWLKTFDNLIDTKDLKMIVAPVGYTEGDGFLYNFQVLDFLSLQGITIGSFGMQDKPFIKPFLCNGANLCYKKESFYEVEGFKGNEHLASGDDVFLLEKMISEFPNQVEFVKSREAIVRTLPKKTWIELIRQRIRWAAKTTAFSASFSKLIGLLVFLTNLLVLVIIILGILGQMPWGQVGLLFLLKFNLDFIFLHKTARFFEQEGAMKSYIFSSLVYPAFTVLIVVLSLKKSYTWKDRKLS